ncbi:MAG: Holliday junction resolvase RuvX [Ignavibacteriales bacterium CG12_big_fil_rev_8_21_14_0_65_30_8]|nr:MAG: Holliday junction resolvase RuvX [Ignavibacteriales bacterium CG12_big_fil_rev_8_21_14_0_65_30_8]
MTDIENLSRILAIDYGTKRIGIALTDPLLTFAYPFETIQNNKSGWEQLKKIIEEKKISKIILGYPTREDGKDSYLIPEINKFKEKLIKNFKIEVILWDEIYTSKIAERKIIESVKKKKNRKDKGLIDSNAAAIMLQEYLDSK